MNDHKLQAEAERLIGIIDSMERPTPTVGNLQDVQDMMLMSADRNIFGAKNDILDAIDKAESIVQIKRIQRACEEYMKAFDFLSHRAIKKWDELLNVTR